MQKAIVISVEMQATYHMHFSHMTGTVTTLPKGVPAVGTDPGFHTKFYVSNGRTVTCEA